MKSPVLHRAIIAVGMALAGAITSPAVAGPPVIDVVGHIVPFVEYNTNFGPAVTYKDWGNEPFIAVNPTNPNQIVVSGFAYSSPTGSLWYSTDGGANWGGRFPITNPTAGVTVPNDQVYFYDNTGTLHGAFLGRGNIYHGSTVDPNNDGFFGRPPTQWTWTATANANRINQAGVNTSDQPWIAIQGNRVVVAYDNFNAGGNAVEMRVAISNDLGVTFPTDIAVSRGGRVAITTNPGLRIATDNAGNVYSLFGYGDTSAGGVQHVNYRLNRNQDFTLSTANPGGLAVDDGNSAQIGSSFGGKNELRGNTTALDVTGDGSHVYTVYGKRDASNIDRLFLAEFHPDGMGGLAERPNPVAFSPAGEEAALPSIAVSDNGCIHILYDTFSGGLYHIHLAFSTDLGLTFTDQELYSFDPSFITLGTAAFPSSNRALGDYQFLEALGNTVYGTFAARGNVNGGGYNTTDSIVPFFFTVTEATVPAPPAVWLTLVGSGLLWWQRRRWLRAA